jgi:hypothetical protein
LTKRGKYVILSKKYEEGEFPPELLPREFPVGARECRIKWIVALEFAS